MALSQVREKKLASYILQIIFQSAALLPSASPLDAQYVFSKLVHPCGPGAAKAFRSHTRGAVLGGNAQTPENSIPAAPENKRRAVEQRLVQLEGAENGAEETN